MKSLLEKPEKTTASTSSAVRWYALLACVYTGLIFILPASKQSMRAYHLSALEYHVLLFAVVLPSLAIWFAGFYGYAKIQEYARSITKAPESVDFARLAQGCAWLAWSLPVTAICSQLLNAIADAHSGFKPAAIIISNELSVVLPLIAFSIISGASRNLVNRARVALSLANARGIMLLFVSGGVLYCYLVFRHLGPDSLGSARNPYYLPIWLMLLLVIIPYLYTWFIGTLAAYEINNFSKKARGLLYRQSLRLLALGLVAVIASSIALQYISSVEPRVGYLVLNYKLILTTVFRLVGGAGFILLAVGATRLKKIEEV
ncbi:MAG: hypothetical protein WA843_04415 [Candidatus Saccharimonadales bacterium]